MSIHPVMAAIVGTALLLSGCDDRGDSGPLITESRAVESFHAIDVKGAATLEITIGEPLAVVVRGHEKTVHRIETQVSGETLHIKSRPKAWFIHKSNARPVFQITVPRLESLRLEGGNDVKVAGFAGGETVFRASGAVNINADGHLEKLTVKMQGAGHADLSRLATNVADVSVDGVGSVIVNPSDSLDATMNGVGTIFYLGSPRHVKTRMNGLGSIGQREPESSDSPSDSSDDAPSDPPNDPPNDQQPNKQIDPEQLQPEREDPKRAKEKRADDKRIDDKNDVTEVI